MNSILTIRDLCFGFVPQEEILHAVSLTVEAGSFLAIIGPNGSGKSTLLKLILGELQPKHGTIQLRPDSTIAYVPQVHVFDKEFPITVLEVVMSGCLGLRSYKERKKEALLSLETVGMHEKHSLSFGKLSGGQAQRVLIARALVKKPSLLLLDEPTSNIDVQTEKSFLQYLHKQKKNMTILMVTHTVQTVLDYTDAVIILQGGAAYMRPKEVCEHFALGLYHEPLVDHHDCHLRK